MLQFFPHPPLTILSGCAEGRLLCSVVFPGSSEFQDLLAVLCGDGGIAKDIHDLVQQIVLITEPARHTHDVIYLRTHFISQPVQVVLRWIAHHIDPVTQAGWRDAEVSRQLVVAEPFPLPLIQPLPVFHDGVYEFLSTP